MLEQLAHRRIRQAQVQLFDRPVVGPSGRGFRGGPVLMEADAALRQTRHHRPADSVRPDETYEDRLDGRYVYAGPLYDHFGHYMAEFVPRIATARMRGLRHKLLFVGTRGFNPYQTYGDFPGFVKEILAFLDVAPRDVAVVNHNTVVEELHLVEPGSDLGGGPKPGYVEALGAFSTPRLDARHGALRRPRKLYVSRSALRPQGMLLGEAWFEEQLEREGFTIFRPEEWLLSPQLDHYRKAEVVVFPEGSACHGTELLGAGAMRRVVLLIRSSRAQAAPLERVLAPRAQELTMLARCTTYLGTAAALKGVAFPRLGVTWIDIGRVAGAFQSLGLADLRGLSAAAYRAAAEADLQRYLDFRARPGGRFDADHAAALTAAFAARAAAASP